MTRFRCVPIPTETADRFRSAGLDDRGNPIFENTIQYAVLRREWAERSARG